VRRQARGPGSKPVALLITAGVLAPRRFFLAVAVKAGNMRENKIPTKHIRPKPKLVWRDWDFDGPPHYAANAALHAICVGDAQMLARYLRGPNPIDPTVAKAIASMLDPPAKPTRVPDSRSHEYWSGAWKLVFEPTEGRNRAAHDIELRQIGTRIAMLWRYGRSHYPHLQDAIKAVRKEFRIGDTKAKIAWTQYRRETGVSGRGSRRRSFPRGAGTPFDNRDRTGYSPINTPINTQEPTNGT
jgi:hypothetical protein